MGRFEDWVSVWQGLLPFAVKHDAVCVEGRIELSSRSGMRMVIYHFSTDVLRLKVVAQQSVVLPE